MSSQKKSSFIDSESTKNGKINFDSEPIYHYYIDEDYYSDIKHSSGYCTKYVESMRQFFLYFCNPSERTILNRSLEDLLKLIGFYICFYTILTAFVAIVSGPWFYFWIVIDYPLITGPNSLLRMNPGLSVVPMADRLSTLIHYKMNNRATYRNHVDTMIAIAQWYDVNYEVPGSTNYLEDCYKVGYNPSANTDNRVSCRQWLHMGGRCNMFQDFGFDEMMPCVMLRLNKIYGWLPDPVENATGVEVKCRGISDADKDNLGEVCYFDDDTMETGMDNCKKDKGVFKSYYYPYLRQLNYHAPIVFVEFSNVKRYVLIMVECFAIAKNIHVDFQRREGSFRFELFID